MTLFDVDGPQACPHGRWTGSCFACDRAAAPQPAEAVERVEAHADPEWCAAALSAVRYLADHLAEWTTDEVWGLLKARGEATHEPRALGAVMRRAVADGICLPTDRYRPTIRREAHGRPVRVWTSGRG